MEAEFIRWLHERLPTDRRLEIPPGDDAAVLRLGGERAVLTVDLLTEGVDFELGRVAPERIGRKALAVNLSDMAAMAARPAAALVALALPRNGALALARRLYEGLLPLAEQHDLAIAGGDTNTWDGPLVLSVTVVGELTPAGAMLRSGARPGDAILVTGKLGGSILSHQFDFEPRVQEALWLKQHFPISAGMDISDGLSLDLSRLAAASGCGAVLELDSIPIASDAVTLAEQLDDGSTPLDHALGDGEDFELLLAVPAEFAAELLAAQPLACGLTRIGTFTAEPGLWQQDAAGRRTPLAVRGFEH